jgi:hypothetical protein
MKLLYFNIEGAYWLALRVRMGLIQLISSPKKRVGKNKKYYAE